ncbi:P27 family phage terminase small subunit, partial [Faecalibaculum rodentium]|uniref:P27 family phage terminase small subunit n=1 Tax=Faecalibaculum rodentium TaxID=1702221 RepID=UPI0026F2AEBB
LIRKYFKLDMVIETLAMIYEQRDKNLAKWEELDNFAPVCEYTNKAGATNLSKHPCYLNNLQYHEQILKYTKELGLTPSGAKKLNVSLEKDDDSLAEFEM